MTWPSPCDSAIGITCSDRAIRVTVLALHPDGTARVDTGAGEVEVSVAPDGAAVGELVLVHVGTVIAAPASR